MFDKLMSPEKIAVAGHSVKVADGDSFAIGTRKFRLNGIDAPEYHQTCRDSAGAIWTCGMSARQSLQRYLHQPGLECTLDAHDTYGRALATCRTTSTKDIGAALVEAGMAISDGYHDLRSYGAGEDTARAAKRGIWAGEFDLPSAWRKKYTPHIVQP